MAVGEETGPARKIIGIDPGTRIMGFCVLEFKQPRPISPNHFRLADLGVVRMPTKASRPDRLGMIHDVVYELLETHRPDICCVERAFFSINAQSSLVLGEARGSILAAAHRRGVRVVEVTTAEVKKFLCGSGRASKDRIAVAVESWFGLAKNKLPYDATDACAVALTHVLAPSLRR